MGDVESMIDDTANGSPTRMFCPVCGGEWIKEMGHKCDTPKLPGKLRVFLARLFAHRWALQILGRKYVLTEPMTKGMEFLLPDAKLEQYLGSISVLSTETVHLSARLAVMYRHNKVAAATIRKLQAEILELKDQISRLIT